MILDGRKIQNHGSLLGDVVVVVQPCYLATTCQSPSPNVGYWMHLIHALMYAGIVQQPSYAKYRLSNPSDRLVAGMH
jgi:hypothetical protein